MAGGVDAVTDAAAGRMSGRGDDERARRSSARRITRCLGLLAERAEKDAEWYGARLVVEVHDRGDTRLCPALIA